jgi:hypothetical protein
MRSPTEKSSRESITTEEIEFGRIKSTSERCGAHRRDEDVCIVATLVEFPAALAQESRSH